MAQRTREELKGFFKAHLIPTEENFSDLVDSALISTDDFLIRPMGSPPTFHLGGTPSGREKIVNFQRSVDEPPTWTLELNPGYQEEGSSLGKGFSITNGLDQSRLFVAESDQGRIGVGTVSPQAQVHVRSTSPAGVVGYSSLKDHLTLELGQSAEGGVGSVKLHGAKQNQFGLIKGGDQALNLDVGGGKYVFNGDPGVSSTVPGQIQIQNGQGAVTVQVHAGGTTYFKGGKVGIGTDQPAESLHLTGSIRGGSDGGQLRIQTATGYTDLGSANDGWSHFHTDRPRFYFNREIQVDSGNIGAYGSAHLQLRTGDHTRMFLHSGSGNVGIGNANPQARLHVAGGSAHFQTDLNTHPLTIGRYESPTSQVLKVGVTDAETIFHYVNDEAASTLRFRLENSDTERTTNKGADSSVHDVLRLTGSKAGGWVGINGVPEAPLSIEGSGKYSGPNSSLHLSPDVLLFGGRNAGYESNSAQISAGLHQANTLCLVGMGKTSGERKIKLWGEGDIRLQGPVSGNQGGGAIRIQTAYGHTDIGPKNGDWSHFYTDRPKYYFDTEIHVDTGKIGAYSGDHLYLHTNGTTRIFANKDNGRVALGGSTTTSAMLHLGDSGGGTPRSWMNKGVYMADGSDGMYVGMKLEGSNRADSIIAWGDDTTDRLRFMYCGSGVTEKEVMRLEPDGDLILGGKKPIYIQRYENRGNTGWIDTGISSSDYTAAISGFLTQDVDINENHSGDFLNLRMHVRSGKWSIRCDIRSHNNSESWYVDVLFISTKISYLSGF